MPSEFLSCTICRTKQWLSERYGWATSMPSGHGEEREQFLHKGLPAHRTGTASE